MVTYLSCSNCRAPAHDEASFCCSSCQHEPASENHLKMIALLDAIKERERADPCPEDKTGKEFHDWVGRKLAQGYGCHIPDWA